MPSDAVVRAVEESPPDDGALVSYDELSQAEQQIAQTAVEEDFYHACPELPDGVRSFAEYFERAEDVYMQYQADSYAMWIRIEDTVRAETASPPEDEPSCGMI